MAVFTTARAALHSGVRAAVTVAGGYGAYLAGTAALATGIGAPVAMAVYTGLAVASGSVAFAAAKPFLDKATYFLTRSGHIATAPLRRSRRAAAATATGPPAYTPPAPQGGWTPWIHQSTASTRR